MADCDGEVARGGQTPDSSQHSLIISDFPEESTIAPECLKEASQIQAIDKASVHRICSGQVVLTLATAVKELVENSIDAGASTVEVKLKDYGSESIEVTDNGSGVDEKDFEGLTLKHHTSKLQDFDDLVNVTSFGFRGEALSSLCALSNMVVTTRHKSAAVGSRLEFDLNGRIVTRKSAPRQIGTTIQVQNIFHSLPVRHKEFQRNLKKEFTKLVHVLNAYCLIGTGVRISCTNQTAKGSRSSIVSTNGNESLRENIANVFGTKQLQSLLEFKQEEADDEVCGDFGVKLQQKSSVNFRIEGYVSKCEHGQGRSSTDRQFIFINRRPCDHTKILKLINEVYHIYNRHQNPFIALSISVDKESVDVNVTPDKRQIFLEGENLLLATLKTSLNRMFEPTTSIYKVNNLLLSTPSVARCSNSLAERPQEYSKDQAIDSSSQSLTSSLSRLKRSFSSAFARSDSSGSVDAINVTSKSPGSCRKSNSFPVSSDHGSLTQFFSKLSPRKSKPLATSVLPCSQAQADSKSHNPKSLEVHEGFVSVDIVPQQEQMLKQCELSCEDSEAGHCRKTCPLTPDSSSLAPDASDLEAPLSDGLTDTPSSVSYTSDEITSQPRELTVHLGYVPGTRVQNEILSSKNVNFSPMEQTFGNNLEELDGSRESEINCSHKMDEDETFITDVELCQKDHGDFRRREQNVSFCLASLRKKINLCATSSESRHQLARSFRAKICPTDNQSAEEELQKEISKDMFDKMGIVGQFNLGFIITRLGRDLFIVDQHASDEKYNFEMLQQDTVLQSQKLIVPQKLELTASNEIILMDNLEVFKKNGFDFLIDPEAAPSQRVKLVSAPISKNWSFGKDDIEELLFMLSDSPNVMCWPSRVRLMFASRACRKSVMIGTALNRYEMKRLVSHMSQIEHPWNCPHGRPTMRHLFNLDMLPS